MIEEKYNIKYIDGTRCYQIDMTERHFNLEFCSPRELIIDNKSIYENSWIHMLQRLFNYLFYKHGTSINDLLVFKVDWSNQIIFSKTKENILYYGPLENNLYFNGNHTSTHQLWIVQDLLSFLGESTKDVILFVKIPPIKEEKEVIEYYKEKNLEILKYFLEKRLSFDKNNFEKFMIFLNKIDSIFEKFYKNQVSLLLLETKLTYSSYKSRFLERLKKSKGFTKYEKNFKYVLDQLTLFYAYLEENQLLN